MKEKNSIRIIKLLSEPEDYAIIFTHNYITMTEKARDRLVSKRENFDTTVFGIFFFFIVLLMAPLLFMQALFIKNVLPKHTDDSIVKEQLHALLYPGDKLDSSKLETDIT
jgi:hypothetical protein